MSQLFFFHFREARSGGWSHKGCETVKDNSSDVTCLCNHLTSFAVVKIRFIVSILAVFSSFFY